MKYTREASWNLNTQWNYGTKCWHFLSWTEDLAMYIVWLLWHNVSKSCLLQRRINGREGINPFPHTTILQQTTLNIFCQNIKNLYNWMDNLWLKVENIVSKGEIARFEQFLLLSLCFQKAVCCRGVKKRLYVGKG